MAQGKQNVGAACPKNKPCLLTEIGSAYLLAQITCFPKGFSPSYLSKNKSDVPLSKLTTDQDFRRGSGFGVRGSFLIKGLLSFLLYVKQPLVIPEVQRYMGKL